MQLLTNVRIFPTPSLSCEVCPGREGPAMFGDSKNGYVLSYTFVLKDCNARGFQRSYSLLFLMTDKTHLVNSFPFIAGYVQALSLALIPRSSFYLASASLGASVAHARTSNQQGTRAHTIAHGPFYSISFRKLWESGRVISQSPLVFALTALPHSIITPSFFGARLSVPFLITRSCALPMVLAATAQPIPASGGLPQVSVPAHVRSRRQDEEARPSLKQQQGIRYAPTLTMLHSRFPTANFLHGLSIGSVAA